MSEVSVCLIVRDGREDLARSLPSFRDVADELIIVDTGSQDGTAEFARRFTDKVYAFPWRDDFAAAKNEALRHAAGDWIFFPDADESLVGGADGMRRVLRAADARGEEVLSLFRREVDLAGAPLPLPVNPAVRLFRRLPGIGYRDPVHEVLVCPGRRLREAAVPEEMLSLRHWGYAPERLAGKRERNLRILERVEREGRQKTCLHYYLTALYTDAGRYEEACHEAELSLRAGERPSFDALGLWRKWYEAAEHLGEQRLRAVLARGRREVPAFPDTYVRLGNLAVSDGREAEALRYFREALARVRAFVARHPGEGDRYRDTAEQLEEFLRRHAGSEADDRMRETQAPTGGEVRGWQREALPLVAARIPARARVVVECGCGDGSLGALFLRRAPGCRWYGFDRSETALAVAAERLSAVGRESAGSLRPASYGISSADVLLYGAAAVEALSPAALREHLRVLAPRGAVILAVPEVREEAAALQALVRAAGLVPVKTWRAPALLVCQRPEERQPGLIVQTAVGERIVCARPRVQEPSEFLASEPGILTQVIGKKLDVGLAQRFPVRVFIRQRCMARSVETYRALLRNLLSHRYLVVLEFDDDPDRWRGQYEATQYIDFRGAHAVQVSTEALARKVRRWNPHVYVLRNHLKELPPARDYAAEAAERQGTVTIFFGAVNREGEYDEIMPVLQEAARRYGSRLRFLVLSDRGFYEALATEAKEFLGDNRVYGGKFVPYDAYCAALDRADISLLPLHDTEFNRHKSDLKFIESAAHGAAVLASPTVYEDTVVDGCTGYLYRSPQEFAEKLRLLIEQPRRRHLMARAAYDYVRRERLQCQHYGERIAAYREMAAQYDTLDRELRERLAVQQQADGERG